MDSQGFAIKFEKEQPSVAIVEVEVGRRIILHFIFDGGKKETLNWSWDDPEHRGPKTFRTIDDAVHALKLLGYKGPVNVQARGIDLF